MTSIYDPVSPSDTYVIYDQFHIGWPNHIEVTVKGWDEALKWYNFYKESCPKGSSLGLATIEYYKHLIKSYDFQARKKSPNCTGECKRNQAATR